MNEILNGTLIPRNQNDLAREQSGETEINYDIPKFETKEMVPIVEEVIEKRHAYSKAFRTRNGSMIATVYKDPVHFQTDGSWQEFDNTLMKHSDETMGAVFKNTASNVAVKIAANGNAPQLISITNDDHELSWGLASPGSAKNQLADVEVSEPEPTQFVIQTNPEATGKSRRAAIEMPQTQEAIEKYNHEKTALKTSLSTGYYPDILPDIDLQYVLQADKVKENIILKSLTAADNDLCFTLKHPGLKLRHNDEGSIDFLSRDNNEDIVFSFPIPFMMDAAGTISTAVYYQLVAISDDESTLNIVFDKDWLNQDTRKYPVIIDPVTETQKTQNDIDDTFVSSSYPNAGYLSSYGSFNVGRNYDEGTCRGLIKFNQLPQLDPGDIIYSANLRVWQYEFSAIGTQAFKITACEPSGAWSPATTWNTMPGTDNITLDSQDVGPVKDGNNVTITPKSFDITRLVRKWYDTGTNNGIMLRGMEDTSRDAVARFFTSNFDFVAAGIPGSSAQYPTGFFYYKNATGLESYWSYHKQNLGRAGMGYVNDFNGNLVFVHPDAATTGTRLPVGIKHVYNFTESNKASRFGYGWRINGMQRLEPTGITDSPYVYTDEDGTKHYFYNDNGVYRDEDGLSLEYAAINDGERVHLITCKDKTKLKFDGNGYLRQVIDGNSNMIAYNYGPHSNGNFLGNVQDGSGKMIVFSYNADFSRLEKIIDASARETHYAYDGAGNLIKITYPDETFTQFSYNGHQLIKVISPDGYAVEYDYANDMLVQRIAKVTEKSGTLIGQAVKMTYKNGNQTVFESCGNDGDITSTSDNLLSTYQFDNMGRPVSVRDNDGNAAAFDYYTSNQNNNKLSTIGKTQRNVNNLIQNPCFEDVPDPWIAYSFSGGIYGVNRVDDCGFMDKRSIKVGKDTFNSMAGVAQNVTIPVKSLEYTLSAYVKTEAITVGTGDNAGAVLMVVRVNADQSHTILATSKPMIGTTDLNINQGWKRVSVTFTVNSGDAPDLKIMGGLNNSIGHAWFDCFQIELGSVANTFNLINDPSFEVSDGTAHGLKYWSGGETDANDGRVLYNPDPSDPNNTGLYQLQIQGAFGKRKSFAQVINVSGEQGDIFHLGCLASAKPIPGREFRVAAAVCYDSGTPVWTMFDFSPYSTEWQYIGGVVTTDDGMAGSTRKYVGIHIYIFFADNNNAACFDSIQLIKDDGKSYVYDPNGELVSVQTAAQAGHFTSDSNGNISRLVTPTGTAFEYATDANNNLRLARNAQGVETIFEYDETGNPIGSTVEHTRMSASVVVGKTYFIRQKTSGKYLDVTGGIDANGTNVCQYTFNGSNGQKWKVLDGKQGYIVLQPACAQTRVLDIYGGVDAEGANAAIYEKNGSEAQRFKLKVLSDGSYQIAAKCAGDKKVLTNQGSYTNFGTNIDIRSIAGENNDQSWYFEPVETGVDVSDPPTTGNTYFMRTRHSGQYWDVSYKATANDSPVVQYYLNRGDNQRYRLELLEESGGIKYFYIRPLHALNKVLKINTQNKLVLSDPVNDDRQKFAFTLNANKTYRLTIKDQNGGFNTLGVAGGSYSGGAALDVYTDQQAETQQFILESISDTMGAKLTYTDDKSRVKTLTDTNGKITTFNYDANNQQLLSIAEPGNRLTQYAYEAQTKHLLSVGTKMEDSTFAQVQFGYEMNRIAKITRNGFDYDFAYDAFGNVTTIKVGGITYLTNDYEPHNGNLKKTTFANGAVVENSRDKMGRLISQNVTPPGTGRCQFRTVYDTMGNAIREIDATTGRLFEYEYDLIGRLIGIERTGSEATIKKQQLRLAYDAKNRVDYLTSIVDGVATKTQYVYGDGLTPGSLAELIYQVMVNDTKRVEYSYDNLARGYTRKLNTAVPFTTTYQIKKGTAPGTTTTLVESITNGASTLSYTYDVFGNILTIKEGASDEFTITYVYDMRNQLVQETNNRLEENIRYTYDAGGNLSTKTVTMQKSPFTATTISYEYDNNWKDKMASYNGLLIESDANGNPTSYYNGLALNWEKARELGSITKSGVTTTYQYTASGIRLEKDTAGVKTQFYLNGSQIMTQISGIDRFDFYYDEAGLLFGFRYNAKDYYYIRNIQNDIIGIVDAEGNVVVNYCYDTWGKLISITGTDKDTVGLKNPFRYRGYYYDLETGFYYLNSRYYDPETGRFINPDIIMGTGDKDPMAYNLFAYCNNNPVSRQDPSGHSWLGSLRNWFSEKISTIVNWVKSIIQPQSTPNGAGGGGGGGGGSWGDDDYPSSEGISGGGGSGGGGGSWNGPSNSTDIGQAVFEEGTSYCFDGALDFAKSPITTQIAVKSFSKGLKVGPFAAMFYANDIRLNYEQYAGNSNNIAIANWIDTAVLVAGVGVGALLAMSALPIVAVGAIALVTGVAISLAADEIERTLID